jgi:hypothetical protein
MHLEAVLHLHAASGRCSTLLVAAQHLQQVVFTHRLGQRQASALAARVVEVRLVKNNIIIFLYFL